MFGWFNNPAREIRRLTRDAGTIVDMARETYRTELQREMAIRIRDGLARINMERKVLPPVYGYFDAGFRPGSSKPPVARTYQRMFRVRNGLEDRRASRAVPWPLRPRVAPGAGARSRP